MSALFRLVIAASVAFIVLNLYGREQIDADLVDIDPSITLEREHWGGRWFTASRIAWIEAMVSDYIDGPQQRIDVCQPATMLWLGNSQLHYVNQGKAEDHVAPFWLRRIVDCPDTTVPLGVSLPNANIQEHYVLAHYVSARLPIKVILLELCFDDLREDGLRNEFSGLLSEEDRSVLSREAIGAEVLRTAEAEWRGKSVDQENAALNGFVQQGVENRLDAALARVWPLWDSRTNLRNHLLEDLYHLRNSVLGINPSTVRRLIPARYERNMLALEALLRAAQQQEVAVVAYIAPIRQDLAIPYDNTEYSAWKGVLLKLMPQYGATLLNLEAIVPGNLWGSYGTGNVDFMHFRGEGHRILANELLPHIRDKISIPQ